MVVAIAKAEPCTPTDAKHDAEDLDPYEKIKVPRTNPMVAELLVVHQKVSTKFEACICLASIEPHSKGLMATTVYRVSNT